MIGTTLSHYRILDRLGQGGMGEVFLAEDTTLGRKVALKFLPSALWDDPIAQERLRREAQSASRLDHPNIVTIFGIEEAEGRSFIHMAHVPGVTLGEHVAAERRTIAHVLDLALQIADGLAHAHAAGVVHRDLKPSNVLVDTSGRARILDFGIASQAGASRLTMTGFTIGTLAYTPPEVIEGHESTAASDLYSFGVVLYQMLTGRLPHEADQDAALLYSILHAAPKPPSAHRSDVPPDVQRITMKLLEKLPENRYADATSLIVDLRSARAAIRSEQDRGTASGERPSIAVLPFANMSADPENEFFSDGLTEELLNVLAKNPALKVTGRTSCFAFKGKHEDLREIGQKLGVATLLEGSVRKAGNRVRITAQLIKAEDGFHLWSETYDRVIDDIFAVQDEIAGAVSAALDVALLGRSTKSALANGQDFALYLQAKHFTDRIAKADLERGVALYEQLLRRNPNDARAWAGLARARAVQGSYGFEDADEMMRLAKEAALKAVELDPELSESHEIMGWILMNWELKWSEGGEAFRKSHALAPGAAAPMVGLACWHAQQGQFDRALPLGRQAIELDPLSPIAHNFLARFEVWEGRFADGRIHFEKALELSPSIVNARAGIAQTYLLEGDAERARAEAEKERGQGYRLMMLAAAEFSLGRESESREHLAALTAMGESWAAQIAVAHAWCEENDEAFRWLDRGIEVHDTGVASSRVNHMLRSLHDDPRWRPFLAKLGLGAP